MVDWGAMASTPKPEQKMIIPSKPKITKKKTNVVKNERIDINISINDLEMIIASIASHISRNKPHAKKGTNTKVMNDQLERLKKELLMMQ